MVAVLAAARADARDVAARARLGEAVGAPLQRPVVEVLEDRRRSASSAPACPSRAPADRRGRGRGDTSRRPPSPQASSSDASTPKRFEPLGPRFVSASFFSSSVSSPTPARIAFEPMLVARRAMLRRNSSGMPRCAIPRERLRTDDVLGEAADAFAHLELLLGEREFDGHLILLLRSAQTKAFCVSGVGSTSPGSMRRAERDRAPRADRRARRSCRRGRSASRRASASRRGSRA